MVSAQDVGVALPVAHTTRVRVLRAAAELFAERGFEATTMRHLAEAADVKAPALYNHFDSKETLLVEAVEWIMENFMTAVAPDREAILASPDPAAELELLVRAHVGRQTSQPWRSRAFHRLVNGPVAGSLPPDLRGQLREARRLYLDLVAELVARARTAAGLTGAAGATVPAPTIAALVITNACEQVHIWFRPDGPLTQEQVGDQLWEITCRIIGAPGMTPVNP